MKKICLFNLLLLLSAFSSFSQQPLKTMSHEDMILLKRVGAPKISPDGKWIIYNVMIPSYNTEENSTDLYLASADGTIAPRKLTNSKAAESDYFWHPTAKKIYFTSKREGDENAQLYSMDLDLGGEAQRLTNLSTGVSSPKISANGQKILFTSKVFPGAFTDSLNKKIAEDKKKVKYKARVYTTFPIRYFDKWLDEKQDHIFLLNLENDSKPVDLFKNISLVESKGFQLGAFSFSPKDEMVVFTATTEYHTSAFQNPTSHLYQLSLSGGAESLLVKDPWDYSQVQFSQDGKYLLALGNLDDQKIYHLAHLLRFNWPSMTEKTDLLADLDRPINGFETKGNSIILSIEDQGVDRIIHLDIRSGKWNNLLGGDKGSLTNVSLSNNPSVFAYSYEHLAAPSEVYSSTDKQINAISKSNVEALSKLDAAAPEIFWTQTSRGKRIRSMLLKPAGIDSSKKYPLFVLMHGGPAISFKDVFGFRWNPYVLASHKYVIVMTDYTGSVGYGEKFAQDIQFDPFKGPGQEIIEASKDAMKRYSFIDESKQAAGGASYGGHLANWMQATTTHFKCLISHAGLMNSEEQWGTSDVIWGRELMNGGAPWIPTKTWKEQNPMRFAANFKTPILLTVGENDFRVPINNTLTNWSILQRLQIPSKLIVFPEENHWILKPENSRFHYSEISNWLDNYLK